MEEVFSIEKVIVIGFWNFVEGDNSSSYVDFAIINQTVIDPSHPTIIQA